MLRACGRAGVLWSVAPSLVLFLLVYAASATAVTVWAFAKRLMQLQFRILQKEGDLRFDLVRTRENSGAPRGNGRLSVHLSLSVSCISALMSMASHTYTHYTPAHTHAAPRHSSRERQHECLLGRVTRHIFPD